MWWLYHGTLNFWQSGHFVQKNGLSIKMFFFVFLCWLCPHRAYAQKWVIPWPIPRPGVFARTVSLFKRVSFPACHLFFPTAYQYRAFSLQLGETSSECSIPLTCLAAFDGGKTSMMLWRILPNWMLVERSTNHVTHQNFFCPPKQECSPWESRGRIRIVLFEFVPALHFSV